LISPAVQMMDADVELSGNLGYGFAGFIGHPDCFKLKLTAVSLSVFSCHWTPLWV
jgi:hypothetical protein